jgi:hypothetical protein
VKWGLLFFADYLTVQYELKILFDIERKRITSSEFVRNGSDAVLKVILLLSPRVGKRNIIVSVSSYLCEIEIEFPLKNK